MRFSTGIRKRFTTGSATTPGGSCDPTGSTSSARGRQGWETGQSSSTYSPGRMRRQCDTPGTSSGPTKSGKRSRKPPMLDTATLSEKSKIECSPRQAIVPLSMRHVSHATTRTTCLISVLRRVLQILSKMIIHTEFRYIHLQRDQSLLQLDWSNKHHLFRD